MKKHVFVCAIVLIVITGLHAQSTTTGWFSIKGFLPEWNNATIQLSINGATVFNGTVSKDMFSYTGAATATKEGQLKLVRNKQTYYLSLFIEPGTIKIRDEGKKLVVYGTATNDTYYRLTEQFDSLALLQRQLSFSEIKNYKRGLATGFIKQFPGSFISLKLLADYFYLDNSADDTLYYQLYNNLDTAVRNSFTAKKLEPEVRLRYAMANGRKAPVIELPDTTHQLFPVYRTGTYTLLNFWSSWCNPCKKEHPALIKLYNQFKGRSFTIVSISLDTNRSAWLNGIKTEKMEWTQLSDLKGWASPAAKLFGVNLIPYNILLDPDGIIIGKNLQLDQIEAILSKKTETIAY